MITVKSLNTAIAQFADLQDLAANFKPWGKLRDYWYIQDGKFINWLKVAEEMKKNDRYH